MQILIRSECSFGINKLHSERFTLLVTDLDVKGVAGPGARLQHGDAQPVAHGKLLHRLRRSRKNQEPAAASLRNPPQLLAVGVESNRVLGESEALELAAIVCQWLIDSLMYRFIGSSVHRFIGSFNHASPAPCAATQQK